ncbi:MAG: EVE domain-containing protein [Spirulinaceae cyanobacterium SM2_1_0]|nr:EVE domain-containing protein [Spirulinaceae cyanobacterium SM2_1_0]
MPWLFQANPRYSRIYEAIASRDQIYWLVTRYGREILPGDRVALWLAGQQAGVYALGCVQALPQYYDVPPDWEIWLAPARAQARTYVPVQLTQKLLTQPLLKSELERDRHLQHLAVIRVPPGTNFRVTPAQWQQLQRSCTARGNDHD